MESVAKKGKVCFFLGEMKLIFLCWQRAGKWKQHMYVCASVGEYNYSACDHFISNILMSLKPWYINTSVISFQRNKEKN